MRETKIETVGVCLNYYYNWEDSFELLRTPVHSCLGLDTLCGSHSDPL